MSSSFVRIKAVQEPAQFVGRVERRRHPPFLWRPARRVTPGFSPGFTRPTLAVIVRTILIPEPGRTDRRHRLHIIIPPLYRLRRPLRLSKTDRTSPAWP
jgi:hypothetical protein